MTERRRWEQIIKESGLARATVCIHASFRSFRGEVSSPEILLTAFLECGCTVIVPAHNYDYGFQSESKGFHYRANGTSEGYKLSNLPFFIRENANISPMMGAFAKTVFRHPDSILGYHPENAFCAIGADAAEIITAQNPWDVYAPYALLSGRKAFLLMAGTDLRTATPIHYAEYLAGRRLFIRYYHDSSGVVRPMRVGGCSDGFEQLTPTLEEIEKRVVTGSSLWRIYEFGQFISSVSHAVSDQPEITKCSNDNCPRCRDAIRFGGPYMEFKKYDNPEDQSLPLCINSGYQCGTAKLQN